MDTRGPEDARGSFLVSLEVALGSSLVSASGTESRWPEEARRRVSLATVLGGVRRADAVDADVELRCVEAAVDVDTELLGGVTVLLLVEGSSPR